MSNREQLLRDVLRVAGQEAVDYVLSREEEYCDYDWECVARLFVWCDTPQGHDYWEKINDIIINGPKVTAIGNVL